MITGATSGIGLEFAKQFARDGMDLVLVGRNEKKLCFIRRKLETIYPISVVGIKKDLSKKDAAQQLYEEVCGMNWNVDLLINNAGIGYVGEFCEAKVNTEQEILQVNIHALTQLTKLYAKQMKERGEGVILNVASSGSYHPGPYTAVYYASKAYVLSFTLAVAKELESYGVKVFALCPGAVKTQFFKRAGSKENPFAMSPKKVVKAARKAMEAGKTEIIVGGIYRVIIHLPKRMMMHFIAKGKRSMAVQLDKGEL